MKRELPMSIILMMKDSQKKAAADILNYSYIELHFYFFVLLVSEVHIHDYEKSDDADYIYFVHFSK